MSIFFIIPAFNSEKTIPLLVEKIRTMSPPENIVVVDDGSVDRTYEIASNLGVVVLKHNKNRGKGAALKTGFLYALEHNCDAVMTLDSDLQHPPELVPKFISALENADVVIGNRMKDLRSMSFLRRFDNKVTSAILSAMTFRRIPDSQCGMRAIRSWVLRKVRLHFGRYILESEFVLESARVGAKFSFVDIPTIYFQGQPNYFKPIREVTMFIALVLGYYPTRLLRGGRIVNSDI